MSARTRGMPARRAVPAGPWRLFRREWRQQLLIVLAADGGRGRARSGSPPPRTTSHRRQGGPSSASANHFFEFDDPEPADVAQPSSSRGDRVVRHDRRDRPSPGGRARLGRAASTTAPRIPTARSAGRCWTCAVAATRTTETEVAVTDWVAEHARRRHRLDARARRRRPDGRRHRREPERPRRRVRAAGAVRAWPSPIRSSCCWSTPTSNGSTAFRPPGEDAPHRVGSKADVPEDVARRDPRARRQHRGAVPRRARVAAASFTVIAQRRLPQLGMLSAVGGTEKHLRLTMMAGGAATGLSPPCSARSSASRCGSSIAPRWRTRCRLPDRPVQRAVVAGGRRDGARGADLDRRGVVAGPHDGPRPTVAALSGRRPEPSPVHRSAAVAVLLLGLGVTGLVIGGTSAESGEANLRALVGIGLGTLSVVAGILMLSPLAISLLGRIARARSDRGTAGVARPQPLPGAIGRRAGGDHAGHRDPGGAHRIRRGRRQHGRPGQPGVVPNGRATVGQARTVRARCRRDRLDAQRRRGDR